MESFLQAVTKFDVGRLQSNILWQGPNTKRLHSSSIFYLLSHIHQLYYPFPPSQSQSQSNMLDGETARVGGGANWRGYNQQAMEEVLRRIYKIKQRNVQRKRIEKALDGEQKYDFREDSFLATPRTSLPFEDQIRFEKDLVEPTRKPFPLLPNIPIHNQHFRLPVLPKRQPQKPRRRKFRGAVWALVFLSRMGEKVKEGMLKRKRRAQKCYKNLLFFVQRLVHGYYEQLLREELTNYMQILKESLAYPHGDREKDILQMLYYMSEKLSNSTVTKDILEFLVQAASNHAFPPADFLTGMEMARLQFSPKFGCMVEVGEEQTRMIVALGLGVKMFCFYVLYQPWKLGMATEAVIRNAIALRQLIQHIASVFYYFLVEEFCLKLKEVRSLSKSLLVTFGIKAIAQLDPWGDGTRDPNTSRQLIVGQNRIFLNGLELRHSELCRGIKANLSKWISRISYATLKASTRKNRIKEQSAYYRTIAQPEDTFLRKQYRSLEIDRGRRNSMDRKGQLPLIPQ